LNGSRITEKILLFFWLIFSFLTQEWGLAVVGQLNPQVSISDVRIGGNTAAMAVIRTTLKNGGIVHSCFVFACKELSQRDGGSESFGSFAESGLYVALLRSWRVLDL
jgi:hypothetical protein